MPFINLNNIKLHYTKSGKGRDLIFLHGGFLDINANKELIELLSKKYCVYAIDLPAHGRSPKPDKYISLYDIAKLINKINTNFKIKNPILFGHSAGSVISLIYASKFKTKELILTQPLGIKYFNNHYSMLLNVIFLKPFVAFYWNPFRSIKLMKSGFYNFMRNIFNKNLWKLMKKELINDYSRDMRKIKCPVTVLWAKQDELIKYRYAKTFVSKFKNAKLIPLKGCHDWPVLRPKEIKTIIG